MEAQSEVDQKPAEYQNLTKSFLGGLLFGAIGAGCAVTGFLELRGRRDQERSDNPFSWPVLLRKERSGRAGDVG